VMRAVKNCGLRAQWGTKEFDRQFIAAQKRYYRRHPAEAQRHQRIMKEFVDRGIEYVFREYRKILEGARDGGRARGVPENERRALKREANQMWRRSPRLSVSAVARKLEVSSKWKARTIRKLIGPIKK
jgi:hypothetical protein